MRTIARASRVETRVRRSRFIAAALPAADPAGALARVTEEEARYPDATHCCWAYRLAAPGGTAERAHDAGEPAGTAGPPILSALRGAGLVDTVVVVTRYFGGTRLGKGGLARAYRDAARAALAAAGSVQTILRAEATVVVPLSLDGAARNLVARHQGAITGAAYTEREARLAITAPADEREALCEAFETLTRGAGRIAFAGGAPTREREPGGGGPV